MLFIATSTNPYSSYSVTLGGKSYNVVQRWNDKTKAWYLDLRTGTNEIVSLSMKLVPRVGLVKRNNHLLEGANLYVVANFDDAPSTLEVTRDNLGLSKQLVLVYITDEELE
jgi:hypothetical protein